jgi:hypothetical protein
MVVAICVFCELDGACTFEMIDGGELAAFRADDGHMGLDGFDVQHAPLQEHEACRLDVSASARQCPISIGR